MEPKGSLLQSHVPAACPYTQLIASLLLENASPYPVRTRNLTRRLLMSYIYIYRAPILDVSRSHTTTPHSR